MISIFTLNFKTVDWTRDREVFDFNKNFALKFGPDVSVWCLVVVGLIKSAASADWTGQFKNKTEFEIPPFLLKPMKHKYKYFRSIVHTAGLLSI